jgi:small subunit ribosomal protein S17
VKFKDERTITVAVEKKIRHPLYNKVLKRTKKVMVHVPKESNYVIKVGDEVSILPSKPISKQKKWTLQ